MKDATFKQLMPNFILLTFVAQIFTLIGKN